MNKILRQLDEEFPELRGNAGIILCTKGKMRISFEKCYLIDEGKYFFFNLVLNPLVLYRKDFEYIVIASDTAQSFFYSDLLKNFETSISNKNIDVFFKSEVSLNEINTIKSYEKKIRETCLKIEQESNIYRKKTLIQYKNALAQKCLLELLLKKFSNEKTLNEESYIMSSQHVPIEFLSHIASNFKHRDVDFYAGLSNFSTSQFSRIIKRYFNKSPFEVIVSVLVEISECLLNETEYNEKEVAELLYFSNQYSFRKFLARHNKV